MRFFLRLIAVAVLAASAAFGAERVSVAAAANLTYVLDSLDAAFVRAHPELEIAPTLGSSGNLLAQISNGAPFDVFLSADMDFPRKLIAAGGADAPSLRVFAIGKLALWTTQGGVDVSSVESAVRSGQVRKLAIANPKTAPYGRAAMEALAKLGLTDAAQPKIVTGENITQTAQFVSTGNADAGFVALSLLLAPQLKGQGRWIEVPASLYSPIEQGAVLTRRGADRAAARLYLDFLAGPEARAIFEKFGYALP
ncbi:MAG TPA: molybdate ABC transporter substrate-binding protein [Opitutaceae bacterium]|jgi:molybdate transport system substrate-binding protein|nr:molybdate ABC transporter substrate-binding protein [Opitutaceae bacterium]